jgi:hypothetical protein
MEDKYTKNKLQNIKTHLSNNIKELTDLREEYFSVGVVILTEYEEYRDMHVHQLIIINKTPNLICNELGNILDELINDEVLQKKNY